MVVVGLLLGWCSTAASGQRIPKDQARLDAERRAISKEIKATAKELKSAQKKSKSTAAYVATLQKQIAQRRSLLDLIEEQLAYTNNNILRTSGVIEALRRDVVDLQAEYGQLVRYAYRQHKTGSQLRFLLAARSLNESYRRWRYLQQYDAFRQRQSQLIDQTQQSLSRKVTRLEAQQQEKTELLAEEQTQIEQLTQEIQVKNRLIGKLKKSERLLADELSRKERAKADLDRAVEEIILASQSKMRRRNRELGGSSAGRMRHSGNDARKNANFERLTRSFVAQKGQLSLPVYNGRIITGFGRQPVEGLKGVYRDNKGITIRTRRGTPVKAVHAGDVIRVSYQVGFNYMVIVQHGDYYTVYSNVTDPKVADGDRVKAGQTLGEVFYNPNSRTADLTFAIYKAEQIIDPSLWLKG